MFKEFLISVISLAFFSVVSNMLMPEGTMKKYLLLTFGFMMMCTLIMPITGIMDVEPYEFSFDSTMSNEEISAKSEAYILKLHEENIREHILKSFGNETESYIDLYSDGRVKAVVIYTNNSDLALLDELKQTLGCENIEIKKRADNDV